MELRKKFDEELKELSESLINMATICETALSCAAQSLKMKDIKIAHKAIELENQTDEEEREIESLCMRILLSQQPVARDLSFVSAALRMITDLERIGDHAEDIAEIVITIGDEDYKLEAEDLDNMYNYVIWMMNTAIEAYTKKDLNLVHKVIDKDDDVDMEFVKIKNKIIDLITKDRESGEQALDFLIIAKYLERVGDHAVNIAEWVEYALTGEHPRNKK